MNRAPAFPPVRAVRVVCRALQEAVGSLQTRTLGRRISPRSSPRVRIPTPSLPCSQRIGSAAGRVCVVVFVFVFVYGLLSCQLSVVGCRLSVVGGRWSLPVPVSVSGVQTQQTSHTPSGAHGRQDRVAREAAVGRCLLHLRSQARL